MTNKTDLLGVEPDYYPDTNTLVNRLNIRDAGRLAQKEADFTAVRGIELLQSAPPELLTFDYAALRGIHKHLFQDLYDWAGLPRSFDFRKNREQFMLASELNEKAAVVFSGLEEFARTMNASSAPGRLARFLNRINFFHPFPEGNGRTQRIFLSLLVKQHGYTLDWSDVEAWEMTAVCQQAYIMNIEPMRLMFERILLVHHE